MSYQIQNLTLGYSEDKILLSNFSLDVPSGQLISLIGRNGIGKSTLLRALARVGRPLSGDILIDGRSIFEMRNWELAKQIAYVSTEIISVAHLRVWDIVSFGRAPYTNWTGSLSDQDNAIATQALESVGITHLTHATVDRLSDGERQRVMIARALTQQTPIILLDEPSAFLDLPNRYQIVMLLREIAGRMGKTIIYSSHDLATSLKLSDSIWVMSASGLVHGTPAELSSNGAFNVIFEGTPLRFDSQTGEVTISE